MKQRLLLLLSCVAFAAGAFENRETVQNPTATPVRPATKPAVDKNELLGHIQWLASPELKGREAGTPEQMKVADYIANEFKRYGLEPWGDDKEGARGYLQTFELKSAKGAGPKNAMKVAALNDDGSVKKEQAFDAATQFAPFPLETSAKEISGEVAFAGYAAVAPEIPYDDFGGVDVAGKWVLILRYEPQEKDAESKFDGTKPTRHSALQQKVLNCALRRALGVLIVVGPIGRELEKESLTNSKGPFIGDFTLPVFQINRAAANSILASSGKTIEALQKDIDSDLKPRSFVIKNTKLSGTADVQVDAKPTANVLARLPGSDPTLAEEVVVVGAHCDHIGMGGGWSLAGKDGDGKVHFGADDNASGTAAMLEVAQAFGALPVKERPKRTVLFAAFTGEESGLLGSAYYVKAPRVPLAKTVAMLNMDMVGRAVNGVIEVAGVASGKGFRELVQQQAVGLPIQLYTGSAGNGPSDHATFFDKGVPVVFFFTGLHEDYHRPSDTWDKINATTAEAVAELARRVTAKIADATERPQFAKAGSGGALGINADPAKAKDVKGFPIASVVPNGPAAKCGLQAGDVIVKLNGWPVSNAMEFSMSMSEFAPGDEVELQIQRSTPAPAGAAPGAAPATTTIRTWTKLVARGELGKK